jgi:phage-related tail fiber protein
MLINLKLNVTITGSTTINISELGVKTLKKINVEGNLVDLASGDLKINRNYLFKYDGTYFVLIGSNLADQISIVGTASNFVSISASNVLQDSGVAILSGVTTGSYNKVQIDQYGRVTGGSQIAYQTVSSISGSSIMSNTTGSEVRHNYSGITSGSYSKIQVDPFGHVTAGSQITGISGSRTFYSASVTGGSEVNVLNTVTFTDGLIVSWTQA